MTELVIKDVSWFVKKPPYLSRSGRNLQPMATLECVSQYGIKARIYFETIHPMELTVEPTELSESDIDLEGDCIIEEYGEVLTLYEKITQEFERVCRQLTYPDNTIEDIHELTNMREMLWRIAGDEDVLMEHLNEVEDTVNNATKYII